MTIGVDLVAPYKVGAVERITITPADAVYPANVVATVPGGEKWRVQSVYFQVTTTTGAGQRYVRVEYVDGDGNLVAFAPGDTAAAGSTTSEHCGMANYGTTVTEGAFSLQERILPAGYSVQVNLIGGLTGDQVTGCRISVDKFIDGVGGYPDTTTSLTDLENWG